MYIPSEFDNPDLAQLHDMMRRHPFALLVTPFEGELFLTHLPFHLDASRGPKGTLEAHLAKVNPHCAALMAGAPSTVVFKGPDAYVSPRWYVDPAKNVPTWNYVAIHAHGAPRTTEDPARLLALIGTLTDEHEAYIENPWSLKEAQAHAERLAGHIVGFELPLARLEGKYKLSQNRCPEDRVGVLREFAKSRDSGVAEMLDLMRELYKEDGKRRDA
ncbi:MAG: FMN-binding negative transcriptional regulator [Bacillota bacterium]